MITITELTSEQKEKLISMIKALYPEYKYVVIRYTSCDYCLPNTLVLAREEKPVHNEWILIHWFDFVVNHLVTKIYNLTRPSYSVANFRGYLVQEIDDIISYLYHEYSKIK